MKLAWKERILQNWVGQGIEGNPKILKFECIDGYPAGFVAIQRCVESLVVHTNCKKCNREWNTVVQISLF